MLFGATLRIPGEFITNTSHPDANAPAVVEDLRRLAQALKPVPGSRHTKDRQPFFFDDLRTCTHVFKRILAVQPPLKAPYSGPHKVIRRCNDRNFVIDLNGKETTVSTDDLKPAYLESSDLLDRQQQPTHQSSLPSQQSARLTDPATVQQHQSIPRDVPQQPSATASDPHSSPQPSPATSPDKDSPPAVQQPNTPPRSRPKQVTFLLPPARATGGGVAVAPQSRHSTDRIDRRKQRLTPRRDFL